jgi:PAS domain S-box-containing protein
MQDKSLLVLFVEDSEDDALLIIRELKRGGYHPVYERVETAFAMKKALKEKQWDIILCDYKMPNFSAPSAIALLKESNIDIPIIIISGAIGEETAVECMRLGAQDYIMKNNLSRLCPAIARELEEREVRNRRKQAEEALRISEERYRKAQTIGHTGNWEYNLQTGHFWGSDEAKRIYGFDPELADFSTDEVENCIPERERVHQALIDLIEADKEYNLEFEIHPRNSSVPRIIVSIAEVQRDEHGNPLSVIGVIQDITERKQAENALHSASLYARSLIESSIDPLVTISHDGRITDVNQATEIITGIQRGRLIGDDFANYFTQPQKAREGYQKVLAEGLVRDYPLTILHTSGKTTDVLYNATVYKNEKGEIQGVFAAAHDITERKRAEENLHRMNRELQAISKCNQTLVRAEDEQTLLKEICHIICDEAGYRMAWAGYAETDDAKTVCPIAWAGFEDGYLATVNITWADTERGQGPSGIVIRGREIVCVQDYSTDPRVAPWRDGALKRGYRSSISLPLMDDSAVTFGALNIYSAEPNVFTPDEIQLLEDLTGDLAFGIIALRTRAERKKAEEHLLNSEKKFASIFHLNPNPISITDIDTGKFIDINTAYATWTGYSREEIIGATSQDLHLWVNPEDRVKIIGALTLTEAVNNREIMIRMKNGDIRNVLYSARFIEINQERYLLSLANDITERKLVEERYRSLFDNAQEGIYRSTPAGKFILTNPSMAQILGYDSPEDLIAGVTDIPGQLYVDSEERKKFIEIIEKQGFTRNYETRFYRKDGRIIWISLTTVAVRDYRGQIQYFEGIAADISDKKDSVEHLRNTLNGTVHAIASIVETRDPYTAGHQRRVADLARAIAAEMGLPADRIEGLRIAATIHDIGKISVPAEMLTKPTKLTNIEFRLIKTHVQAGYDILKDIEFPWPVARMVIEHHERINGSGYPHGLTGDDLLLESRILAAADVVEAMGSHRPYRASLGIEPALEEIEKNKGILYDIDVADACLRLFREKGYNLI